MTNRDLAMETILEANIYIGKVIEGMEGIIDNFLAGREGAALNNFSDLVEGLQWLVSVVNLTKPLTDELDVHFLHHEEFLEKLKEIIEAFENRDYVLVGDLLNYEIKPILEEWQTGFSAAANRINNYDKAN